MLLVGAVCSCFRENNSSSDVLMLIMEYLRAGY
jgi:hypothetical protein